MSHFWLVGFAIVLIGASGLNHVEATAQAAGSLQCSSIPREQFTYDFGLHRFTDVHTYDSCNAAILDLINLNGTIAACYRDDLKVPKGFDSAIPLYGKDPIVPGRDIILGFILVCREQNIVVLSLAGTYSVSEAIANYKFIPVPPAGIENSEEGVLVHLGFYSFYKSIQSSIGEYLPPFITKGTQLIVTGHSLGAAIATLAALDLSGYNPIVYTFASPRVGNQKFATVYHGIASLSNTWRVFNTEDDVPTLPPAAFDTLPFVYEHVGNPVPFTLSLGLTPNDNHVKAYYLTIVKRQPPVNPNGICPNRFDCTKEKCL